MNFNKLGIIFHTYDIECLKQKLEEDHSYKYLFFWGHTKAHNEVVDQSCLSQWFPATFTVNDVTYLTAEHWMMAQKASAFRDKDAELKVLSCETPKEAKEIGRGVKGFDQQVWELIRYNLVVVGNIHKFNQHPDMMEYLLKTGERILVEASPVDAVWGAGLAKDSEKIQNPFNWRGLNLLGFTLSAARDFLRAFGRFEYVEFELTPPWVQYSQYSGFNVFWGNDEGGRYVEKFRQYFEKLSERDQVIMLLQFWPPVEWTGFFTGV